MSQLPKGPYLAKIEYSVIVNTQPITHTMEFNCSALGNPTPGSLGTAVQLATKGGGTIAFSTAIQQVWDIVRAELGSSVATFVNATLWRYDGPLTPEIYITTYNVTNPAGGGVGGTAGHQITLTFRTGLGRIAKILIMESNQAGKAQSALVPNASGNMRQKLAFYVLSTTGWIAGRGGTFPVVALKDSHTYNEALERRRFRPNV